MGKRRENVMRTITDRSSSTALGCSSKIIDIEMNPPVSLSAQTTVSSPISRYPLINMLIIADLFMLLGFPECHSIHCLKLCDINEKKFGLARYL